MRITNTLVAGLLLVSIAACSNAPDGDSTTAGESTVSKIAEIEVVGARYDIKVENHGYEPTNVQMKVGEEATLVFTRLSESSCGESVVIPSLDIERKLPLNQPVAIPFTPTNTGEVAFACGMSMMKGAIIVVE